MTNTVEQFITLNGKHEGPTATYTKMLMDSVAADVQDIMEHYQVQSKDVYPNEFQMSILTSGFVISQSTFVSSFIPLHAVANESGLHHVQSVLDSFKKFIEDFEAQYGDKNDVIK